MSSQWSLKAPKHRISVAKNKVHSYSIGYNNIIQLSSVLRNVKRTSSKFSILPAFLSDHLKQTSDSRERFRELFSITELFKATTNKNHTRYRNNGKRKLQMTWKITNAKSRNNVNFFW